MNLLDKTKTMAMATVLATVLATGLAGPVTLATTPPAEAFGWSDINIVGGAVKKGAVATGIRKMIGRDRSAFGRLLHGNRRR